MPTIIIQSDQSRSAAGQITLSERIIVENLRDDHYAAQLLQRLGWAAADAEAIEAPARTPQPIETPARTPPPIETPARTPPPITAPARTAQPIEA